MYPRPIHPFPARMASELALARCHSLPAGSTVLDPMAGSGTVLRAAVDAGLHGVGFDLDPLAVLMAKVWTTPIDSYRLNDAAAELVARAGKISPETILPWIDEDQETRKFVDFWFAPRQQVELRQLCAVLVEQTGPISDALRVALSRIIITKDKGASLARDVSHSRPHRVRIDNDFKVMPAFLRSVHHVSERLTELPSGSSAMISLGDARCMPGLPDASVDAVITSPPYLNALDYMRGHRFSLVWLGFNVRDLRGIRAESIGTERMLDPAVSQEAVQSLAPLLGKVNGLPRRIRGMVNRFLMDLLQVLCEVHRVLKPVGNATFVIGNSCLQRVFIDNAAAVVAAADTVGLQLTGRQEREIPPARRYLPPPSLNERTDMKNRMRTEVVLTFSR
jgi:tRNA G10  N-methylase Trm11